MILTAHYDEAARRAATGDTREAGDLLEPVLDRTVLAHGYTALGEAHPLLARARALAERLGISLPDLVPAIDEASPDIDVWIPPRGPPRGQRDEVGGGRGGQAGRRQPGRAHLVHGQGGQDRAAGDEARDAEENLVANPASGPGQARGSVGGEQVAQDEQALGG